MNLRSISKFKYLLGQLTWPTTVHNADFQIILIECSWKALHPFIIQVKTTSTWGIKPKSLCEHTMRHSIWRCLTDIYTRIRSGHDLLFSCAQRYNRRCDILQDVARMHYGIIRMETNAYWHCVARQVSKSPSSWPWFLNWNEIKWSTLTKNRLLYHFEFRIFSCSVKDVVYIRPSSHGTMKVL